VLAATPGEESRWLGKLDPAASPPESKDTTERMPISCPEQLLVI
jgi:hypothetical protein